MALSECLRHCLAALSTFKLIRANSHGHTDVHSHRHVGGKYLAVYSFFSMSAPLHPPREHCDLGDTEYYRMNPVELHVYQTDMFERHFMSQPTPSPTLPDGSLTWDAIVLGS